MSNMNPISPCVCGVVREIRLSFGTANELPNAGVLVVFENDKFLQLLPRLSVEGDFLPKQQYEFKTVFGGRDTPTIRLSSEWLPLKLQIALFQNECIITRSETTINRITSQDGHPLEAIKIWWSRDGLRPIFRFEE